MLSTKNAYLEALQALEKANQIRDDAMKMPSAEAFSKAREARKVASYAVVSTKHLFMNKQRGYVNTIVKLIAMRFPKELFGKIREVYIDLHWCWQNVKGNIPANGVEKQPATCLKLDRCFLDEPSHENFRAAIERVTQLFGVLVEMGEDTTTFAFIVMEGMALMTA